MPQPVEHLHSLADAVANLQRYLLSDQVFWQRGSMPSLCLGGIHWDRLILGHERRLLDPDDRKQFDTLEQQIDQTADHWHVAWERKAVAEARARLNLWRAYLNDMDQRPSEAQSFPHEVRNRYLAEVLLEMAGEQEGADTLRSLAQSLDHRLKGRFRSGEFVWEPDFAVDLPQDKYWYLYGSPRTS